MALPPGRNTSQRCSLAPFPHCCARRGFSACICGVADLALLGYEASPSNLFAAAERAVAVERSAGFSQAYFSARAPRAVAKRRGQQYARPRPVCSVKSAEKRPGRQRRAGEVRPAGSRAWIDRPRDTRGGGNHPTRSRASERHMCTCGGSLALLCAAAARGDYSTIHTKPYNPPAEVAPPSITAHTLRPLTAT